LGGVKVTCSKNQTTLVAVASAWDRCSKGRLKILLRLGTPPGVKKGRSREVQKKEKKVLKHGKPPLGKADSPEMGDFSRRTC